MMTMEETTLDREDEEQPATAAGLKVAELSAVAPPYGKPVPLILTLTLGGDQQTLEAINSRGAQDREALLQRLRSRREDCDALGAYRRASQNLQAAEAALADAQRRERAAASAIEAGIRANDEAAVTLAEAAQEQAEKDIRRQTERRRVLQEIEESAKNNANWALRHTIESERLRLREQVHERLREADGKIVAALAELLGESWALRCQLAWLHVPSHLADSAFHHLLTI